MIVGGKRTGGQRFTDHRIEPEQASLERDLRRRGPEDVAPIVTAIE